MISNLMYVYRTYNATLYEYNEERNQGLWCCLATHLGTPPCHGEAGDVTMTSRSRSTTAIQRTLPVKETQPKTLLFLMMSARNTPRKCTKCAEEHLPPLIDDLCIRTSRSSGGASAGVVDGESGAEGADNVAMSQTDQLQNIVTSLAESVQTVNARVISLESKIADYFKRKTKKHKKKRKPKAKSSVESEDSSSTSPGESSSESSSECDSEGASSVSSFASGASAGDRGRSKHKKSVKKKSKKSSKHRSSASSLLRKSQFTHKPFIERGKPVNCFERLMVCSLRMMKDIMTSGINTEGVLTHLIVLAEKAATGYYRIDSIIAYDRATRMAAAEKGIGKFSLIDNSLVLQYLCYDGSVNATTSSTKGGDRQRRSAKSGGLCYRFNKSSGCDRDKCRYLHVCSNCGDGAHGLFGCRKPKYQGATGGAGAPGN